MKSSDKIFKNYLIDMWRELSFTCVSIARLLFQSVLFLWLFLFAKPYCQCCKVRSRIWSTSSSIVVYGLLEEFYVRRIQSISGKISPIGGRVSGRLPSSSPARELSSITMWIRLLRMLNLMNGPRNSLQLISTPHRECKWVM